MTVAQAFQELIKSLNLTDDEKKVDQVIKELQQQLAPREVRLSGSVGRRTAMRSKRERLSGRGTKRGRIRSGGTC